MLLCEKLKENNNIKVILIMMSQWLKEFFFTQALNRALPGCNQVDTRHVKGN